MKVFLKKIEKIQQARRALDDAEDKALKELTDFLDNEESPPSEQELIDALQALFYSRDTTKNPFISQRIDITGYVDRFERDCSIPSEEIQCCLKDKDEQRSYCYIKR